MIKVGPWSTTLATLVAQLGRFEAAVRDDLTRLQSAAWRFDATQLRKESVKATFGQIVRVAPSTGETVTVSLPQRSEMRPGSPVGILRSTATGTATVTCSDSTVNRSSSVNLPEVVGVYFFHCDGTAFYSEAFGGGVTELPIGSVYMAVVDTDPETLLGYGTWERIAEGRVLVGLDTAQTWCDTLEETGGSIEHSHTLASHVHSLNSHTHGLNSHTHSLNSHVHAGPSHTHGMNEHIHYGASHTHSLNSHTHTLAHTHGSASHDHVLPFGVSGTNLYARNATNSGSEATASAVWAGSSSTLYGYQLQSESTSVTTNSQSTTTTSGPSTTNTGTGGYAATTAASPASTEAAGTGNTGAAAGDTGAASGNTAASTGNTGTSGILTTGSTDHRMEYLVVKIWKRTA